MPINLVTNPEQNKKFIIELLTEALEEANKGNISECAFIYITTNGDIKSSECANSFIKLVGLVEWVKTRWILKYSE